MVDLPKYYCALMFKGLYLEKLPNNKFLNCACCTMERGPEISQIDFKNDSYLKDKRSQLLKQPIKECKQCWDLEESTGKSHRTAANQWFQELGDHIDLYEPELMRFDYNVDLVCNARCISCSSWFSSLWAAEDLANGVPLPERNYHDIKSNAFDNIDVSKLQYVYFNGGEPMLSKQPQDFLSRIDKEKGLEDVTAVFSTNGSTMPSDTLMSLLKKCKKVGIAVSLDGTNEAFEYIRNPLSWSEVEANSVNMSYLSDNITVDITNNIGVHNIDELTRIHQWYCEIRQKSKIRSINYFYTIGPLSLHNASDRLLKVWRQKLSSWQSSLPMLDQFIKFLDSCRGQKDDTIWLNHLQMIDRRRGLDWTLSLSNLNESFRKT